MSNIPKNREHLLELVLKNFAKLNDLMEPLNLFARHLTLSVVLGLRTLKYKVSLYSPFTLSKSMNSPIRGMTVYL